MNDILRTIFGELGDSFRSIYRSAIGDDNEHGLKASFAKESTLLSHNHTGFCVTGTKNLSRELSYRNILINAVTGKGKSTIAGVTSCINLAKNDANLIIHDPSKEIIELVATYLTSLDYGILRLDFANPNGTTFFNPVQRAMKSVSRMNQLATQLVTSASNNTGDAYWQNMGIKCITLMLQILKYVPKKYHNLYNLAFLLENMQGESTRKYINRLFAELADEHLFTQLQALISTNPNTLKGIISSSMSALTQYSLDEGIAYTTHKDTIDFTALRTEKVCLFIHSHTGQLGYYGKPTSLFCDQLISFLFEKLPEPNHRDIFFILDEAPTIPFKGANSLDSVLNNCRKYSFGFALFAQDAHAQLRSLYGADKAQAIISGCYTKLYLGAEYETAKMLSDSLGEYEYEDDENRQHKRPLMTPTEIMNMDDTTGILITSGKQAIKVKLTPYYKQRKLRNITSMPHPDKATEPTTINLADIPLIPLTTMFDNEEDVPGPDLRYIATPLKKQ